MLWVSEFSDGATQESDTFVIGLHQSWGVREGYF